MPKFANIEKSEQKEIISVMNAFAGAKDRLSVQDDMRKIKKGITGFLNGRISHPDKAPGHKWKAFRLQFYYC